MSSNSYLHIMPPISHKITILIIICSLHIISIRYLIVGSTPCNMQCIHVSRHDIFPQTRFSHMLCTLSFNGLQIFNLMTFTQVATIQLVGFGCMSHMAWMGGPIPAQGGDRLGWLGPNRTPPVWLAYYLLNQL